MRVKLRFIKDLSGERAVSFLDAKNRHHSNYVTLQHVVQLRVTTRLATPPPILAVFAIGLRHL